MSWIAKITSYVIFLILILSIPFITYQPIKIVYAQCGDYGNPCGTPPGYTWSCPAEHPYYRDGSCYDQPESNYLSNGCPAGYPYIWSDGYCYDQPESNYLSNGCPVGYPYLHSDGWCWDIPECPPGYYYAVDGLCYPN